MTKDEALKLAREALVLNNAEWKALADSGDAGFWEAEEQDHYKQTEQAITAIKEALANEALKKKAENARQLGLDYYIQCCTDQTCPKCKATTPPQRPSRSDIKPLTDEEIERIYNRYGGEMINCARAIERAHGIKGEA